MSCPHVSDIFAPTARGAWRTAYFVFKGTCGDAVNALLSGVAMNFGKLLAWVGRFWLFLRAVIGDIFSHGYHPTCLLSPAFSAPTTETVFPNSKLPVPWALVTRLPVPLCTYCLSPRLRLARNRFTVFECHRIMSQLRGVPSVKSRVARHPSTSGKYRVCMPSAGRTLRTLASVMSSPTAISRATKSERR